MNNDARWFGNVGAFAPNLPWNISQYSWGGVAQSSKFSKPGAAWDIPQQRSYSPLCARSEWPGAAIFPGARHPSPI